MNIPDFGKLSQSDIRKISMMYIDKKVISRIWLSYGTLFLEFGKLDDEGRKGEISFMIAPSWNFQSGYCVKENIGRHRDALDEGLKQYIGKKLMYSVVDEYTHELRLDFGDVLFSTLSTADESELCRTIFFNNHSESTEIDPISRTMVTPKKDGIHFLKVDTPQN